MSIKISPEDNTPTIQEGYWEEKEENPLQSVASQNVSVGTKILETADITDRMNIITPMEDETVDLEEIEESSSSPLTATPNSGIVLTLDSRDLWAKFSEAGTEMIITKSGRRMFPSFVVSTNDLQPDQKYTMTFRCNSADSKRYKFVNSKWEVAGKAESHVSELLSYVHPDSPAYGKHWLHNKIQFKKVKLTNNKSRKGQITLNSMHKYIPSVIVSKFISKKNIEVLHVQNFPEATFFAVTAYQNDQVTQLKIDHNPFAKAFRDTPSDHDVPLGFNCHTSWFSGQPSSLSPRWPPPSPLLPPTAYPQASPLMSPKWPPMSPLISPYHGDFTQVTFSQMSAAPLPLPGPSPLPQFGSVFGSWDVTMASNMYRPSFQLPSLPAPPTSTSHDPNNDTNK